MDFDKFIKALEGFAIAVGGGAVEAVGGLTDALEDLKEINEQTENQLGSSVAVLGAYEVAARAAAEGGSILFGVTGDIATRQLEAARAFNEATGFAATYNKQIMDTTFANRDLGLSAEEISGVFSNLTDTFTDFTIDGISPTEAGLVETAMVLQALGIPAEATAKSFQVLRKGLGQTDGEIARTVLGLENFAEELGVSSKTLIQSFNEQMPVMTQFGDNAEHVFRRVSAASKSSGMEVKTIMSMFDLTDTFEGSTEAVGRLNALLQGPFLNAVEITMMDDPIERMQAFSTAMNQAGFSADVLANNRRLQNAFVEAIPGIENNIQVMQLARGEFDLLTDAMDAQAKDRDELSQEAMIQRTAEENKKVFMEVLKGVDGVGQSLDEIFRTGFTPLANSAEKVREKLKGGLGEELDIMKNSVDLLVKSLGDVEAARATATVERRETARQPTEPQGDTVIRLQVLLDGEEIAENVSRHQLNG